VGFTRCPWFFNPSWRGSGGFKGVVFLLKVFGGVFFLGLVLGFFLGCFFWVWGGGVFVGFWVLGGVSVW